MVGAPDRFPHPLAQRRSLHRLGTRTLQALHQWWVHQRGSLIHWLNGAPCIAWAPAHFRPCTNGMRTRRLTTQLKAALPALRSHSQHQGSLEQWQGHQGHQQAPPQKEQQQPKLPRRWAQSLHCESGSSRPRCKVRCGPTLRQAGARCCRRKGAKGTEDHGWCWAGACTLGASCGMQRGGLLGRAFGSRAPWRGRGEGVARVPSRGCATQQMLLPSHCMAFAGAKSLHGICWC